MIFRRLPRVNAFFDERNFKYQESTISSTSEHGSFSGLFVKSLGEHWSVGAFLNMSSSTYGNIKFNINPAPAVEFNVFPYSESTRRELRILYRVGLNAVKYREETIYLKMSES